MENKYTFEIHEPLRDPRDLGINKVDEFPETIQEWLKQCIARDDFKGLIDITKMELNWTEICKDPKGQKVVDDVIEVLEGAAEKSRSELARKKASTALELWKNKRRAYFPKDLMN